MVRGPGGTETKGKFVKTRKALVVLVVVVLVGGFLAVGALQDSRPPLPALEADEASPEGYTTVTMIVELMRTQMDSFGGWLPNDLPLSPSFYLDNTPQFQLGVLQVVRHASRVLRDNLSRQRTSDAVDRDADLAYSAYANDPLKWAFPSAESAFGRGNAALLRFRDNLGRTTRFYPRADNLVQLLDILMSELGAVNTRLLEAGEGGAVGWLQTDDNFYWGQGVRYAMLGLMRAVERDFAPVIADKNAGEIVGLIIKSLDGGGFDPLVVTNGSKGGILASHSNNLKAYLDDARQKMNSLVTILKQG